MTGVTKAMVCTIQSWDGAYRRSLIILLDAGKSTLSQVLSRRQWYSRNEKSYQKLGVPQLSTEHATTYNLEMSWMHKQN